MRHDRNMNGNCYRRHFMQYQLLPEMMLVIFLIDNKKECHVLSVTNQHATYISWWFVKIFLLKRLGFENVFLNCMLSLCSACAYCITWEQYCLQMVTTQFLPLSLYDSNVTQKRISVDTFVSGTLYLYFRIIGLHCEWLYRKPSRTWNGFKYSQSYLLNWGCWSTFRTIKRS